MKNNLHYFKISQENLENLLDDFYIFDKQNVNLKQYVKNIKNIKDLLITIKTLQDRKEKPAVTEKYFKDLQEILNKFSNCSEFVCFVNACDNTLEAIKNDIGLLKKITEKYFQSRTLNEVVPEEWVQAILDTNASRRKGKCGEIKLKNILVNSGFIELENWEEFFVENKCVVSFSKSFNLKNVRKNLKIKIQTKKQNKTLDLIIKSGNRIFLLEAKHLNVSGGEQDKQISELIEILGLKENNPAISYISFLDGNYSNRILNQQVGGSKLETQRAEIAKNLKENPRNFWLNTAGFKELFKGKPQLNSSLRSRLTGCKNS